LGLLGWGYAFTSEGYSFVFKGIIWEEKGGVELEEKVASDVVFYSSRDAHVLLHWST